MVCELLLEESNVHYVSTPVTVCGDIHGQVMIILLTCFYTDYVTAFNFVFHSFMTLKSCLELVAKYLTQTMCFLVILLTEATTVWRHSPGC